MFPFWDRVIAPAIEAAEAKRIVEIGALRGETTVQMLERLGPGSEIHVIDPVPEFDPSEHERAFPGRYVFHRDLSHNVLPTLPPVDAALIDGDHNWYTVYHELQLLSASARDAGELLPLLILHDVGWPYGRRDLYYAPEQIPDAFRQPYAQRGMRMGRRKLLPGGGGLNPTMYNAVEEGGPRNGVMTALDDFMEEYDRPLRRIVLPIYFGLAIVAETELLDRRPALAKHLDWLETDTGKDALLELAEHIRLEAMVFQHNVFYRDEQWLADAARRYLDLLKGALLDEHYLENELRIDHLVGCLERGIQPDVMKLRDPARHLRDEIERLRDARRAGRHGDASGAPPAYFPFATMGRNRLDHLERCLDTIRTEGVAGDLLECGTDRGGGAIFMRGYLEAHHVTGPRVWVADGFRAAPPSGDSTPSPAGHGTSSVAPGGGPGFPELLADLNNVRDAFARFDLLDERVHFLQGDVSHTLPDASLEQVALLRVGPALAAKTLEVLEAVYDRISLGGFVLVDEHANAAVRDAVDEFRRRRAIGDVLERIDWTGACWRKTEEAPSTRRALEPADRPAGAPVLAPGQRPTKDLSIVIVVYNMRREAERTLHSLSRSYQEGVEDLDYEVVVVENGSSSEERLGEAFVRGFGPEFHYLDVGDDAPPSPIPALNRGITAASGNAFALMIDGAHVLTPGVLRFGMQGLRSYDPAIVATQQWYVGPGEQNDAIAEGYDQAYEDQLFESILWPENGYELFHIGHFIGDRDWFDGIWESNCLFVPRALLEQVGAFDEGFSMPGGGYANLELYERVASSPHVTVAAIVGEGSFHQLHGGTTTNQFEFGERKGRIATYAQHYQELKGRPFRGPAKTIHYVGRMQSEALRTKPRRRTARHYWKSKSTDGPGGLPRQPTPIPDELREEFLDAYWHSLAWAKTSWLGQRVGKPSGDLMAYQEILAKVRPGWVVEIGTGNGARALFLASILDLLGHGQVLSIAPREQEDRPQHPRITYVVGNAIEADIVRQVHDLVCDSPNTIVILGARGTRRHTVRVFEAYADLVPAGSYVVIEDTVVNGHPVWPEFGGGPAEAVKALLNTRADFAPDRTIEKHGITFNPGGFLKRLR